MAPLPAVCFPTVGHDQHTGHMPSECEALLVSGIYGSGKSSLVEEIADRFEGLGVAFGAIDLDWLGWYLLPDADPSPSGADDAADQPPDLQHQNLADVAGRYWQSGAEYLLLAGAAKDDADVERIRKALPCPLYVVRLDTPIEIVERRLSQAPTSGRANDLLVAQDWVARDLGRVSADLTLPGDAALSGLADQVLGWLGWPRVR